MPIAANGRQTKPIGADERRMAPIGAGWHGADRRQSALIGTNRYGLAPMGTNGQPEQFSIYCETSFEFGVVLVFLVFLVVC